MVAIFRQFEEFWFKEIKPLALKCIEGGELIGQFERATTTEEKRVIQKKIEAYGKKDWEAVYCIGEMVFYVEHALYHERDPRVHTLQVCGCLNSENYYADVFQNGPCEESQNYRRLARKLDESLKLD